MMIKKQLTMLLLLTSFCMVGQAETNDSLFSRYVQQRFDASLPGYKEPEKASTRSGADGLTGADLALYNALVPKIKAIAAGTVHSTVVSIPVEQVYPGQCGPFTAEQISFDGKFWDNNGWNPAIGDIINELWGYNLRSVLTALLSDYPLELYWFDKTAGIVPEDPDIGYDIINNKQVIYYNGNLQFSFYVVKEYAASNTAGTTVTKSQLSLVSTAIANAHTIVDNFANYEPAMSPLEKLWAYFCKICQMENYNFDAVENGAPYGNPWQLIWAFDNDPDTRIVCEGYSKAFKYLCDLSGFEDIECLLATGDLGDGGATPAGPHMWNVVRMDDGRNYLCDLTNADYTEWSGDQYVLPDLFMVYCDNDRTTGSYNSGYAVQRVYVDGTCSFTYDNDCKSTFGVQALTLSPVSYEAPALKANLSDAAEAADIATQLDAFKGQEGVHVNYKRTGLTVESPITFCMPFAYRPQYNVGTFYTMTSVTKDENELWVVNMTEVASSALEANKPYILIPSQSTVDFSGDYTIPASLTAGTTTVGSWTLRGNYANKSWSATCNDYGFMPMRGLTTDNDLHTAGAFVRVTSGATCAPMRCYLTYGAVASSRGQYQALPNSMRVVFHNATGDTTGIGEWNTATGEITVDDWYDLSGRRLNGRPETKGVYIHNGKKVLVK